MGGDPLHRPRGVRHLLPQEAGRAGVGGRRPEGEGNPRGDLHEAPPGVDRDPRREPRPGRRAQAQRALRHPDGDGDPELGGDAGLLRQRRRPPLLQDGRRDGRRDQPREGAQGRPGVLRPGPQGPAADEPGHQLPRAPGGPGPLLRADPARGLHHRDRPRGPGRARQRARAPVLQRPGGRHPDAAGAGAEGHEVAPDDAQRPPGRRAGPGPGAAPAVPPALDDSTEA